jgi:hypothetical protein
MNNKKIGPQAFFLGQLQATVLLAMPFMYLELQRCTSIPALFVEMESH